MSRPARFEPKTAAGGVIGTDGGAHMNNARSHEADWKQSVEMEEYRVRLEGEDGESFLCGGTTGMCHAALNTAGQKVILAEH